MTELVTADKELIFQNEEKEKRAVEISQLNRLYLFISQINQAIVHLKDEQTLFYKACNIAVEQGRYRMAFISIAVSGVKKIKRTASYGMPEKDLEMPSEYEYEDDGPIDKIMKGADYVTLNDINKAPQIKLKKYAEERGMNACIFLALKRGGKTIGVFNIYSTEKDFFTSEEIKLLIEAAGDISFAIDIFEKDKQKQEADDELRHSEQRLNEAQAIAHIGSWEVDFSTGIFTWSDELLRIYGLPERDYKQTYQSWISFIHPEDIRDVIQKTNEAKSALSDCEYFSRIIRKDGTIRHLYTQTRIEFNNLHKPKGIYGVTHDITEMKEAEKALRKSESNLHAIFENTSEGFILADTNGIIIAFNNKLRDTIWLNTEQEINVGDSISNLIHPSRKDGYKNALSKVLSGEVLQYDYPYTGKSGETKWFNFTVNPVYNGSNITGLSITSADITERKQAEQLLKESELFNKGILASLHSQIAVINESGTLIAVNGAWNDFSKENGAVSLEHTFVGSNYFDVCKSAMAVGGSIAGLILEGIQSVFKKESEGFEFEYPCHSPGEERWFRLNVSHFGNNNSEVVISHQNITKRKIAENKLSSTSNELQKTLTDLNKILDSSLDVICTINANGEFVKVNTASQKVWGYAPEELIGTRFMDLVYHEDADATSKAAEKIADGIPVPVFENRYVHKSGRVVPILWSTNWDEKLQLLFCVAKDVTEIKKLEKAIKSERDQFFEMFLKAPSAIGMLKGADHIFEMVNPLYLQIIGKKDVIGKTVAEVLPEIIEQGFIGLLDGVYKTGKSYTGTEMLVKLDKEGNGKMIDAYLNFVYQAYKNNEGNIEGIFFFANDITEQIQARKKIEKSEKQYRQIVETAQEGIWLINKDNQTSFVNKKMCEILEYSEEEMMGKKNTYFMDEAGKKAAAATMERRKKGIAENIESEYVTKSGRHIQISMSASPFLDENEIYRGALGMVTDITEKKKLQELLAKANKLARIGNYEVDLLTNNLYWSDITKQIHEVENDFTPDVTTAINFYNPGQSRESILNALNNAIENGVGYDLDLQIITAKNNTRWVRVTGDVECINGICKKVYGSFQDIDAGKKAELEVLKAYEEKNFILESIGDAFFAVDKNWVVTYWNNQAEKMLMKSKNEIVGHVLWEVFFESVNSESYNKYHQALETNEVIHFEDYYEQLDKWYQISAYPLANGLSVYFSDETERKRAERQIKTERNLLRTLIDSLPDAIYFKDTEAKKLISNKFDYNMLGATAEEAILGKTDLDVLPENIGSITYSQDINIIKTGEPLINFEEYVTSKNGKQFWLLTTKLPLRNEKNEIIGLLGIGRDITDEKIADEKLQLYQSNLKAVIDNTDAAIYSLDKDFRYITFNQFFHDNLYNLYGLDIKIGDTVYDLLENLNPEEVQGWEGIYSKALKGGTVKVEREFKVKDFYSYISFSVYPIWKNKKIVGLSCFAFDITKKRQEDLQKEKMTADLIQRNKDLEQFSYIVSHNLRSPVANIIGLSEELTQGIHDTETNEMLKRELSSSVKRLDNVIRDLNNILRVNGGINEKKETVRLLHMIESIQSGIRNIIRKEKVQIKTDFSIINEFITVKSYLYSIFYNLILNSIKYHRPGLAPVIEIKSEKYDGKLILTLKDNGSGIDMAKNGEHIFGLYKRFHQNIEGKGMGLFMVKAQVETLGGKITVKSELNKGTEFTIEFTL